MRVITLTIGILASHQGSLAQAVIDACEDRTIDGRVGVVVSNNSASRALERARAVGIRDVHLSSVTHPAPEELDVAVRDVLADSGCDLVVLAGYMRKIGPHTLTRFPRRILNVHPALLPRHGGQGMYGSAVHAAVATSGDDVTGATVHLVSAEYDRGPVVAQRSVDIAGIRDAAAIESAVRPVERALLVETIASIARTGALGGVG